MFVFILMPALRKGLLSQCLVQKRMEETRALFRDPEATQFVIVTIPTAMAAAESARLAKALLEQQVLPCPSMLLRPVDNELPSLLIRSLPV